MNANSSINDAELFERFGLFTDAETAISALAVTEPI